MRKYDVFGRKLSQNRPFYILVAFVLISVIAYGAMTLIGSNKLATLETDAQRTENQIQNVLESETTETYLQIEQLTPFLPNTYSEAQVVGELDLIRNLSGLALAEDYQATFQTPVAIPFDEDLSEDLQAVSISISMKVPDAELILDYLDELTEADRIYYVKSVNVQYMIDSAALVTLSVYTFYYDQD
ncbi:MAG: hypothetical protein JXB20_03650 [Bacilli bacterium]|nr:hypothetical protein [Bacilli bacterium]MBN2696525.1 hypothetical protein [Bacilli bacterium]